jgi:predicted AAA+ superfamily ATPase
VTYAVPGKDKMKQEIRSLLSVKDAFKKILVVKENTQHWHTDGGIAVIGLMDFLLNSDSLEL